MSPLFDLICPTCYIIEEDVMLKIGEQPTLECPECGRIMNKKPDIGSFELKYNNKTDICDWAGNTSQYWRAYKEAKSQGKDVKPGDSKM